MSFYQRLVQQTRTEREALQQVPLIQNALAGRIDLATYMAFLAQAYHHVRHTVPLLEACRRHLPARHDWLKPSLDEYVKEEEGHDQWILEDLRVCGADPKQIHNAGPGHEVEVMVAYAYDGIQRGNPLSFFGMVHVLEGTSVALALRAADGIQQALGLPDQAFSYLRSHGVLDQEHTGHFELLMDQINDPSDQKDIVHGARQFYRLYANVFRGLMPVPEGVPA
jgi:pyrroloquinoline quinone (PQQ) biosynthesis protein C